MSKAKTKKKLPWKYKSVQFVSYLYKSKDGIVQSCGIEFASSKHAVSHFKTNLKKHGYTFLGITLSDKDLYISTRSSNV